MLVEDERRPAPPLGHGCEQQHVRRVGGMDDIDGALVRQTAENPAHVPQRGAIFLRVTDNAAGRELWWVAVRS